MEFLNKFDKQQVQKITLIVIAALTILALVLLLVIVVASVNPADSFGLSDGFSNMEDHTVSPKDYNTGSLIIINSKTDKYDIPSDEDLGLISLKDYRTSQTEEGAEVPYSVGSGVYLNNEAAKNLHIMIMKMIEEKNFYDAVVNSGFRSVATQTTINPSFVGHSDHHSGMLFTFDFTPKATGNETEADKTAKIQWLDENAHKYGVILRYPADKAEQTGVKDYTEAYRYVGIAHAAYIKANDLCLEEYVEYLKANTNQSNTLKIDVDGATYKVYYVACEEGGTIKVPKDAEYTISGTNVGGVIVTVKVK